MKNDSILILGVLVLMASCAAPTPESNPVPLSTAAATPELPAIHVWGSLPGMHKRHEIATLVKLSDLMPDATLIGLGAATNLDGELTVLDGHAYVARPRNGKVSQSDTNQSSDAEACMFVAAKVKDWVEFPLDSAIPMSKFDAWMTQHLDTTAPIPFTIQGHFQDLNWHVVDGANASAGDASCASHSVEGIQMSLADSPQLLLQDSSNAVLVGFWSKHHKAVFTRHDSENHTHVIVAGVGSGHVDSCTIPAGATLRLPAGVSCR